MHLLLKKKNSYGFTAVVLYFMSEGQQINRGDQCWMAVERSRANLTTFNYR